MPQETYFIEKNIEINLFSSTKMYLKVIICNFAPILPRGKWVKNAGHFAWASMC